MSLIVERKESNYYLGIWKISEEEDELLSLLEPNKIELERMSHIQSAWRRKEWMASRLMASNFFEEKTHISYDAYGRPVVDDRKERISISHSKRYVAVLISASFKPTIDIELPQQKIRSIAHKFINEKERQLFDCTKSFNLYRIWCAKECAFKYHHLGGVDFKEHILVEPDGENIQATFHKNDELFSLKLKFETNDNYVLCFNDQ